MGADTTLGPELHPLDVVVLAVYVLAIVGLGVHLGRRGQSTERFTVADRSLPGWLVGFSIIGTLASSISFLAYPGASFSGDWNAAVFGLTLPPAAWLTVRYFIPYYRASREVSAYSHLERRFGPWARNYGAVLYVLYQLGRMASITYLMALPLHHLLGWPVPAIIVVMGVLVVAYTLIGGIEAVIWTDLIQTVVLIGGALVAVGVLLAGVPGGAGAVFEVAWREGKLSLGSLGPSLSESTLWVVVAFGLMENVRNFGIDQTFIQRYATASSDREAARSVWLCALGFFPLTSLLLFVGTALFVYYAARPELLPARLHALDMADHVFPYFIVDALPVGLSGLLIAAIFAAGMSTIDSGLNSVATLTLTDFYRRYVRPAAGERESLWVLRAGTVGWGLVAVAASLAIIGVESALDVWWQFSSLVGGALLGLFLLGLISRRPRNGPALVGVAAGVLLLAWMSLAPALAPRRASFDLLAVSSADPVRTDLAGERELPRPRRITGVSVYGEGRGFAAEVGSIELRVREPQPLEPGHRLEVPRWRRVRAPSGGVTENLIQNGEFLHGESGLAGWEPVGEAARLHGDAGRVTWSRPDDAAPGRAGLRRGLDVDLGRARNAVLSLEVRVDRQSWPGAPAGEGGLHAPLQVEVAYLDDTGAEQVWKHAWIVAGESASPRVTRIGEREGEYARFASPFHGNLGNLFGTATIVVFGFGATILADRLRGARPAGGGGR